MGRADEASGFVLLDKPSGMTSFQALRPLKKFFGTPRVGHAGTLDQEASGLIIAAVGKCTRLLGWVEAMSKAYEFTIHLGRLTDTLEWSGDILAEDESAARTPLELLRVAQSFCGEIDQIPPVYSAIKIRGVRASDRALRGETVHLESRRVRIDQIEILSPREPEGVATEFRLRCICSKGTYIRSLGRDLGAALGTVACVSRIRRIAVGRILVEQACAPESPCLLEPNQILDWPVWPIGPRELASLRQGRSVAISAEFGVTKGWAFASFDGCCQIAGEVRQDRFEPRIVLKG